MRAQHARRWRPWLVLLVLLAGASTSLAHMMPAQRGTINFVDNGGFMVVSLPVPGGSDDNGDGLLSLDELQAHAASIEGAIRIGVQLVDLDSNTALPLQAIMLSLASPGEDPSVPSDHLLVMGRFDVPMPSHPLQLRFNLFGSNSNDQSMTITATRKPASQLLVFTPTQVAHDLFVSPWRAVVDATRLGANHVLGGLDHLLFLLVVVVAGWRLRQLALVLSCFTLGHACTLLACIGFGVQISATIVEPAIAATIVAMAIFDWRMSRRPQPSARLRLLLVFGCALIHGLGLAGALSELGLHGSNKVEVVVGFNLGIELAQLTLALGAVTVLYGLRRYAGPRYVRSANYSAWSTAIVVGTIWFIERVAS